MASSKKWLHFETLQVCIWRLSAEDPYLSKTDRHVHKAASRKWLHFETLQVCIWRLSAEDPYLSKPDRHVHKAASRKWLHFESLQLDTNIWSLPADDSYLSKPYNDGSKFVVLGYNSTYFSNPRSTALDVSTLTITPPIWFNSNSNQRLHIRILFRKNISAFSVTLWSLSRIVSEWLLLNANSAIFQL